MDQDYQRLWLKALGLYGNLKQLLTLCEELGEEFKTFIHPMKEMRDALDHIMRAEDARRNHPQSQSSEIQAYSVTQMDKAVGHLYRGFFDAADWLALKLRQEVGRITRGYDNECLMAVLPEYYSKFTVDLRRVEKKIARMRSEKDIAKTNGAIIEEVDQYRQTINELLEIHDKVSSAVPALQEFKTKQDQSRRDARTWDFKTKLAVAVVSPLAAALIAWFGYSLGAGNGSKASPPPVASPAPAQPAPSVR